jgi:hypothetical protein
MKVFLGAHKKTAILRPYKYDSIVDFYKKCIKKPRVGKKGGVYFTTADNVRLTPADEKKTSDGRNKDHFRRLLTTHLSSWCVCIDGDASKNDPNSCVPIEDLRQTLDKLKINYIIYTTYSYIHKFRHKWRCIIPCKIKEGMFLKQRHKGTVDTLYDMIESNGCGNLKRSRESYVLSQMWFLPVIRSYESDYKSFIVSTCKDFEEVDYVEEVRAYKEFVEKDNEPPDPRQQKGYSPEYEIIDRIVTGTSPLHESITKFIYGNIKDGRTGEAIKATLHGLTRHWDLNNKKLSDYKLDFDRLVNTTVRKFKSDTYWTDKEEPSIEDRIYTSYPDQGGMMEKIVQCCMDWMIFPNRQIAVTAARTLISTLGARTYAQNSGKGIALTALLTGRSTIGKSYVKKFFIWIMNNFQKENVAHHFLGSHYHTSVKNLVTDLKSKYSLLTIRTESGHTDKSLAGDMPRVMLYELEFSTESGPTGFISSGAQNDKIPALYSPAVTTIRESVAKIQSEADILNQSVIAGVAGRRSVILIDPIKSFKQENTLQAIPSDVRALVVELYKKASQSFRKDYTKQMHPDAWVYFDYTDKDYLIDMQTEWLNKENEAALLDDDYKSTFYGRLYERVPAYAGILAIADNPGHPVITNNHLRIAEQSLLAELLAYDKQQDAGADPIETLVQKIELMFRGDMKKNIPYYSKSRKNIGYMELDQGALEWEAIQRKLNVYIKKLTTQEKNYILPILKNRLSGLDIEILGREETERRFKHRRITLQRL